MMEPSLSLLLLAVACSCEQPRTNLFEASRNRGDLTPAGGAPLATGPDNDTHPLPSGGRTCTLLVVPPFDLEWNFEVTTNDPGPSLIVVRRERESLPPARKGSALGKDDDLAEAPVPGTLDAPVAMDETSARLPTSAAVELFHLCKRGVARPHSFGAPRGGREGPFLSGATRTPKAGTIADAFIELFGLLESYAKSGENQRDAALSEVLRQARALEARLDAIEAR